MDKERIILTREGRGKLCEELDILKNDKRKKIAKDIAEARALGDLSENAEYHAAKEAQAANERRINEIEDILIRAKLIDDDAMPKDEALLGANVKVKDENSGEVFDYMLVSEEESDFEANKISITSPVGKALLGHKADDVVEIKVPAGAIRYKIVSIRR